MVLGNRPGEQLQKLVRRDEKSGRSGASSGDGRDGHAVLQPCVLSQIVAFSVEKKKKQKKETQDSKAVRLAAILSLPCGVFAAAPAKSFSWCFLFCFWAVEGCSSNL